MSELALTLGALGLVVIVLSILILVLVVKAHRQARAEKVDLAARAAENAMREGLRRVRGETWLREHSPRR